LPQCQELLGKPVMLCKNQPKLVLTKQILLPYTLKHAIIIDILTRSRDLIIWMRRPIHKQT